MAGKDRSDNALSSPPCFMHEVDPTYLGYMSTAETIELVVLRKAAQGADHDRRSNALHRPVEMADTHDRNIAACKQILR